MEGYFKQGVLHGFGRYFDEKGRLKEIANHRNGLKFGTCWKIIRGGGCVVGRVNKEGDLTGHRIAYLYPDYKTALVGSFTDGVMECAQEAELKAIIDDNGIKVPLFTEPTGNYLNR
jgi:histone-lysine N-methyltransferase SETD7